MTRKGVYTLDPLDGDETPPRDNSPDMPNGNVASETPKLKPGKFAMENPAFEPDLHHKGGKKFREAPPMYKTVVEISDDDSVGSFSIGCIRKKSNQDAESGILSLDDSTGRDTYDKPIEFLLSCISMSVGFGSLWRFPFTAYENGGGAFLIPYFVVLLIIGAPIYYLEMCMGQFSSSGHIKIWSMAPAFKGVGYGSTFAVVCIISYYIMLIGVVEFYFIAGFAKDLPWDKCDPSWEDVCYPNGTVKSQETPTAQLYYELEVFPQSDNIDDGIGVPEWRLTLCLLVGWILVFLTLVKGVKVSAKTTYFTALFPYVVLFILLIQGCTLDGAWKGIEYFITPEWDHLYSTEIWFAAAGQCLFSLGAGMGAIIVLASYNPFRHNVRRDAIIMTMVDGITSMLAGFTVFAALGNLSQTTGLPMSEVAKAGPGLAFVSYPAVIATFQWAPQLFSFLFFLMLLAIGVGSAAGMTEGVITVVCDQFPNFKRWAVTTIVCGIGFLIGLVYVTPGGQYLVTLVDYFGSTNVIYLMVMIEVAAISWVYGLNNFCKDVEFMSGAKVGIYWKICWGFCIPVGLFVVFVYTLITQDELTHEDKPFPTSAIVVGWLLTATALLMVVGMGIHGVISRKADSFKDKLYESLKPSRSWGPKAPKIRAEWEQWKAFRQ